MRKSLLLLSALLVVIVTPVSADETVTVAHDGGGVALDGERELELRAGDRLTVTLRCDAFRSIDVPNCMRAAVARGLFQHHDHERGTHG